MRTRFSLMSLAASLWALLPAVVQAQTTRITTGLGTAAGKAGFGTTPKSGPEVVKAIVEAVLALSGVVFVVLLVWGGIQYLLSRGNPDMVKSAKGTMVNAVIGLVIIVSSYAIVTFLFTKLALALKT